MGRHARRFSFSGYLIYRPMRGGEPSGSSVRYNYVQQRVRLINALESDDAARLVHPVFAQPENGGMMVMCERYSMTESRERGGYTQFDMTFVEAGTPGNAVTATDTQGKVVSTAKATETAGVSAVDLAAAAEAPG
jgi:prophage DNA circulation protein